MSSTFSAVAVQSSIIWEYPEASRLHFESHLASLKNQVDLIVLPEMFTTGFSMEPKRIAELYDDEHMATLQWMIEHAKRHNAIMTGSVAVKDGDQYFNRLIWARPDGTHSTYDKRHLFRMAGEHQQYSPGKELLIEEWKGWKICPLICYDLRFPVWSRNRLVHGQPLFDIQLYVANWPSVRREPWKKLLLSRAIENQCYLIGVNRVGVDGNKLEYTGDSAFINPRGEYLQEIPASQEGIFIQTFDRNELDDFRQKFPVLEDADDFQLL